MEFELFSLLARNIREGINSDEPIRCAKSNQYTILSPNSKDIVKKGRCTICFDDHTCSIYIPELGNRTFAIKDPHNSTIANGIVYMQEHYQGSTEC